MPCPPSHPVSSTATLMRSRVSGSASRFNVSAGPPDEAQLGIRAASVVHPGRYGYVSRVTSMPAASFSSIMDIRSGALPLFSEKLSVACVRSGMG
jgi:hypothetical protein